MRFLPEYTGGRPFYNDDLLTLQQRDELFGLLSLLADVLPCVVSGCAVYQTGSQWNVGPGIVWDGSHLFEYPGGSSLPLPLMFAPGAGVSVVDYVYQDGTTHSGITERLMTLVAVDPTLPQSLVIDTYGALTFWHRVQQKTRSATSVEWLANVSAANYDAAGLGKPGTEAWGWGLCDGQGGRADLRARFIVGQDSNNADYATPGTTGGAASVTLTVAQIPSHAHDGNFRISDSGQDYPFGAARNSGLTSNGSQITTKTTGGSQPFDNRPPYLVLAARQWVGF